MLLSEIVTNKDYVVGFLRFQSKERLLQLQKGLVYLNTFQFFKDLENEQGIKGQGDAHDLSLIINNLTKVSLIDLETGAVVMEGSSAKGEIYSHDDYKKHLYCLTAITPDMLEIISKDGDTVQVKLSLSNEFINKVKNMFGEYVMFISKPHFLSKIHDVCTQNGYQYVHGKVNYKDMSVNHLSRFDAFNEGRADLFFEKDIFFEFQNEYRIVVLNAEKDGKALQLQIGDISGFTHLLSVDRFLEHELRFSIRLEENENIDIG